MIDNIFVFYETIYSIFCCYISMNVELNHTTLIFIYLCEKYKGRLYSAPYTQRVQKDKYILIHISLLDCLRYLNGGVSMVVCHGNIFQHIQKL